MILPDSAAALFLPPFLSLLSAAAARALIPFYECGGMVKANYLGRAVPAALGPALLLGYLAAAAAAAWSGAAPGAAPMAPDRIFLLTSFAFFGLWDDLIADEMSGFRGHFGAAKRGRITGGLLKILTALLVGLIFTGPLPFPAWRRLASLLLLLLSANGINLFDRRPGRALKIFFLLAPLIILLSRSPDAAAAFLLPLMGGALAIAPFDLEGRGMLGDCGANMLGAALGTAALLYLPILYQTALLLFWIGIHIFSEYRSLSLLIEGNPLLRRLDGLGRFREKLL